MKTCKTCGGNEFYTDGRCKACHARRQAKYRALHHDKILEKHREYNARSKDKLSSYYFNNKAEIQAKSIDYRLKNKDSIKKCKAENYAKNREAKIAATSKWRKENPEARRIMHQNRRAKKKANNGRLSRDLSKKLFSLQRGKCACCKLPLGSNYHLDHRMPLALGGAHEDKNMQLLRAECNMKKHTTDPISFMQSKGYLL